MARALETMRIGGGVEDSMSEKERERVHHWLGTWFYLRQKELVNRQLYLIISFEKALLGRMGNVKAAGGPLPSWTLRIKMMRNDLVALQSRVASAEWQKRFGGQ